MTIKVVVPTNPATCPKRCVYSKQGVCDDPRTNKGNSDASCYKFANTRVLSMIKVIKNDN